MYNVSVGTANVLYKELSGTRIAIAHPVSNAQRSDSGAATNR